MTTTYKMATKWQQVAKDIIRAAKELDLILFYRCNRQLHTVEFELEATDYDLQQMKALLKSYKRAREDEAERKLEMAYHIYG